MDSSNSSKNKSGFQYWNNWKPSVNKNQLKEDAFCKKKTSEKQFSSNGEFCPYFFNVEESSRFGAWFVPEKFLNRDELVPQKKKKVSSAREENVKNGCEHLSQASNAELLEKFPFSLSEIPWEKDLNRDWGKRIKLQDIVNCKEGEMVWGFVGAGLFGQIKLWLNEYGYICGSAEGILSDMGNSEMSLISITNPQLLRKMLNITKSHWLLLSEMISKTKLSLKFDALKEYNFKQESSLEKLWFFLCKRRHFFPEQCMLMKLNGAVKCLKEFKIIPKFVVQDIRGDFGDS